MKRCPICEAEYSDEVRFCPRDGGTLRSASPAGDLVGQVIADRYHVIQKLGEGGMGKVYLAEHVKMGRRSAIKVMSSGIIADADAISRFNREAANASRISHPNVCAIYDFGETPDGVIYLAMEYIEGQTLNELLRERGPLPLPRAAAILHQCAEALQAAHDLGIVHRDLKPDNVMVISSKGRDLVKVVDFGIAKATATGEAGQKVTRTGLVVGTPEYMSPEQLSGDTVDGRSDIYSLGLVCYRMLTGALPFQAASPQETMVKRLTEDPLPLELANPARSFPSALQSAMSRALARLPRDRYSSATQFAADVSRAVEITAEAVDTDAATQVLHSADGGPTEAIAAPLATPPPTRISPPRPRKRRSAVIPVAGAAAVLIGISGLYASRTRLFGGSASVDAANDSPPVADSVSLNRPIVAKPAAPVDTSLKLVIERPRAAPGRVDDARLSAELDEVLDSITEAPQRRGVFRSKAEANYADDGLADSLRAKAAAAVAQAYLEDADLDRARVWFARAASLNAKYQRNVELLERQSPN